MDSEDEGAVGGTPFNESSSSSSSGRNSPVEFSEAHGSPLRFSPKGFGKNSPVAASSLMHSPLSKSKVLELKKDELKERLESLGHEAIGTKVQLQKQLQAVLSPGRSVKAQREQMDLERQWQREDKDREFLLAKLKLEAEERKELRRLEEKRLKAEEKRLEAETTKKRLEAETTKKRLEAETTEKRLA